LQEPDVLLLDEPTNHLDLDAIEWLEGYLKQQVGYLGYLLPSVQSQHVVLPLLLLPGHSRGGCRSSSGM
jgi:ABC-type transport system involved in cytochrome bd biosynthesis fused ATPase/permease subunit